MTETVLASLDAADELFHHFPPKPLTTVDVLGAGPAGDRGRERGLRAGAGARTRSTTSSTYFTSHRRNPTDVELTMFAQANSEHCRHKIFNASWVIDGEPQADVALRHDPHHARGESAGHRVSAYSDNAAVMEGATVGALLRGPASRAATATTKTRRTR